MTMRPSPRPSGTPRLIHDERGLALIEFAFVLPFMVLLFIGGFQLMDAISAYRKVGRTVRTLSDLTTQDTVMTDTRADEILNASRQVMSPYSPSDAAVRISQIKIDADSRATVSWSRSMNTTGYTPGAVFTLPPLLVQPNRYYVLSEITYTYRPKVADTLIGTIPLTQSLYMSPRNSAFIAYN